MNNNQRTGDMTHIKIPEIRIPGSLNEVDTISVIQSLSRQLERSGVTFSQEFLERTSQQIARHIREAISQHVHTGTEKRS